MKFKYLCRGHHGGKTTIHKAFVGGTCKDHPNCAWIISSVVSDGGWAIGTAMDMGRDTDFHAGDHVALLEDDWTMVGLDLVMIDAEPVPGSSQCLIQAGSDVLTVSRVSLRRI